MDKLPALFWSVVLGEVAVEDVPDPDERAFLASLYERNHSPNPIEERLRQWEQLGSVR